MHRYFVKTIVAAMMMCLLAFPAYAGTKKAAARPFDIVSATIHSVTLEIRRAETEAEEAKKKAAKEEEAKKKAEAEAAKKAEEAATVVNTAAPVAVAEAPAAAYTEAAAQVYEESGEYSGDSSYYNNSENSAENAAAPETEAVVQETEASYAEAPAAEEVKEQTASAAAAETEAPKARSSSKDNTYQGEKLNAVNGMVEGPSGTETYYNLNMSGVISNMQDMGINGDYWVRDDGVKMYGDYVMAAANLDTHPYGSIVESSLGDAIVVDTGDFAAYDEDQLDIAVEW